MSEAVVHVVAAVIEHNWQILICQRKPGGRHPLKWEFPGGKVEPGEEPRAAIARELQEELGIEAEIGEEIERYDFRYYTGALTRLIFYRVTQFRGELQNLDFAQIRWEQRANLPSFDFLEGDIDFVKRLAAELT